MGDITASMVKELRQRTGVGMMDCKKALVEAGGDTDEAVKVLRKAGAAKAEKKAGRSTGEGRIGRWLADDGSVAALVEFNCETDFVARNDEFISLADGIAKLAADAAPAVLNADDGEGQALTELELPGTGDTVAKAVTTAIGKLGENMKLRRFHRTATEGVVGLYIHAGDKIGVLVEIVGENGAVGDKEKAGVVARDVAMHVAAANPRFVGRGEVDQKTLDDERDIFRERTLAEGKPAAVVDKIVEGRMGKFYQENCLLEQSFVKNPDLTVEKHVSEADKSFRVVSFARFAVGD
jgi:elongation factor Ts